VKALAMLVTGAISLAAGVFVFRIRCRRPFYYGLTEIVFGMAVFVFSVFPSSTTLVSDEISPIGMMISKYLTLAAGLYIVVRGLDNIDRSEWPEVLKPYRLAMETVFYRKTNGAK
jgi:hypothetical protein